MSYFLKSGTSYQVTSKEALDLHEKLPVGNYVVKKNPTSGVLYLETIDPFTFAGKQYGDISKMRDRVLHTFQHRPNSTGVMLAGEKGSGKSLLAKLTCIKGYSEGIPTIVINSPWVGDDFNELLQNIEQPTIVLFDEFEKVYDTEDQEKILTLLDGVFPSKKLFIITCNDKWRVDNNMRNRPGRIFYMVDFSGLAEEFIVEYCKDNLKDVQHITRITQIASLFSEFNFDMLKALIEEMNRFDESPDEALKMLNVKPEFDRAEGVEYSVQLFIDGVPVNADDLDDSIWKGNPLLSEMDISYKVHTVDKDGDAVFKWFSTEFKPLEIKKIDPLNKTYVLVNGANHTLILTRCERRHVDAYGAF